jgi:hypothetical protein
MLASLADHAGQRKSVGTRSTQIDARRMWRITCGLLLAFLAAHRRQAGNASLLEGPLG